MKLIAKTNILYHSHMYVAGEELPQSDQVMIKAWLDAGTAEYVDPLEKAAAPIREMAKEILNKRQEGAAQETEDIGVLGESEAPVKNPEEKAAVLTGRKKGK